VIAAIVFLVTMFWRRQQRRRDREALLASLEHQYSEKVWLYHVTDRRKHISMAMAMTAHATAWDRAAADDDLGLVTSGPWLAAQSAMLCRCSQPLHTSAPLS
jgi:hypothetical protein